ncbi:MAG: hypothetical protein QGF03_05095, partial [SAR324 cluster bacterium]|nr:hypothetical protein [SAR324 cluster bacterium]
MKEDEEEREATYSISYQDAAGNAGATLVDAAPASPIRIDTTPPSLSGIKLSSDNQHNTSLAKATERVTLEFTSSEPIEIPTVTLAGETVEAFGDGTNWTAMFQVNAGDDEKISSPKEVEGLMLWLDGSNINGEDNSGLGDTTKIGQWLDLSGRGNHFSQGDSSRQPSYALATKGIKFNGNARDRASPKNALVLDAPNSSIGEIGGSAFSLFIVARPEGSYFQSIFSAWDFNNNAIGPAGFQIKMNLYGGHSKFYTTNYGGSPDNLDLTDAGGGASWDIDKSTTQIYTITKSSGENFFAYTDGTKEATGSMGQTDFSQLEELRLGDMASEPHDFTGNNWGGYVYEVILIRGELTKVMEARLHAFLAKKWNLTSTVDSDGDGTADVPDPTPVGDLTQPKPVSLAIAYADEAGNAGTVVTQTDDDSSVGVDTTAPDLIKVEVASSNSNTQGQLEQLAKAGDTITLTVESSEALRSLSVVGGDGSPTPLTAAGDTGREWTVSRPVESGENGELSFTLNYEDLAGNVGASVSNTTNNSKITFDTTPPSLSDVVLASTNANDSIRFAKKDDELILTFNSSELIVPTVTLAGRTVTASDTSDGSKTSWKASYSVEDGDSGTVTFTISYADAAGNPGGEATAPDAGNQITMDTTPPTLTQVNLSGGSNNLANADDLLTLSFTASEKLKNPVVNFAGKTINLSGTQTSWSATYRVQPKDDAGRPPIGMEGLVLWLDATNVDGVLNQSLADEAPISEWKDLSGSDHHAGQSDTSRQPKLLADGINTKPAVKFNRAKGDYLKSAGFDNGQDLSIFMVFNSSNAESERVYAHGDGNDSLSIFQNGSDGFHARIWAASSNTELINAEHGSITTDTSSQPGLNYLLSYRYEYSSNHSVLAINGQKEFYTSNALHDPTLSNKYSYIGAHPNPVPQFDGSLAEIIVIDGKVTESIATDLYYYLSNKWGLATTVDSDGDSKFDISDDLPADLIVEPKPVLFNIAFEDEAGNRGLIVDTTTDSGSLGIDTTAPELRDISIVSNNPDSTTAKAGDVVTLSFTTTEPIQDPGTGDVTISGLSGVTLTGNDNKTEWTASGTVTANASGNAAFSITVLDNAGNRGSPETTTTDGTSVTLDTTLPTLSDVVLASSNANDSTRFAKEDDDLILEFTSSEDIQRPTVTLAGFSLSVNLHAESAATTPPVEFSSNLGGAADGILTLLDNKYADLSADVMDDWGTEDFEVSLSIKANSGTNIAGDSGRDYTALFIRSSQAPSPYTGPSAFLYNNGEINFRLRGDDKLELPAGTVSSWADWVDLRFKYSAAANKLQIFVNGVEKGSRSLSQTVNSSHFVNAPLRFGGNHVEPEVQSLNAQIKNLYISEINEPIGRDWRAVAAVESTSANEVVGFSIGYQDIAGNSAIQYTSTNGFTTFTNL